MRGFTGWFLVFTCVIGLAACGEVPLLPDGGADASVEESCTANAMSCGADDALYRCNESGTSLDKVQDCQYGCSGDHCKACAADTTFCSGDDLVMCNADGEIVSPQSCSNGCQMDRCNVCKPGVAYCDNANAVTCNADGTPGASKSCGAAGCVGGVCNSCQPNTTTCQGDTLVVCDGSGKVQSATPCALGCGTTPNAHCRALVPSYGVPAPTGTLPDLVVSMEAFLDIAGCSSTPPAVTMDNGGIKTTLTGAPQVGVVSQTGGGPPICVVRFKKITVASSGTLRIVNGEYSNLSPSSLLLGHAISLQATSDVQISGTVVFADAARGPFPGPDVEGYTGKIPGAGGAGAAHAGGAGGACVNCEGTTIAGGAGGPANTNIAAVLRGGSEGGYPWVLNTFGSRSYSALGGFGGGALHLVSLTRVTISATGVINVNGGGGRGAAGSHFGSGGGSGGTIVVEAPAVSFSTGALAVAKGGGGSGSCQTCPFTCTGATPGENGQLGTARAKGGSCGGPSDGGWEADGTAIPSANGASTSWSPPLAHGGGGGGGSSGFIILRARDAASVTFAGNAVVSPMPTIGAVTAN